MVNFIINTCIWTLALYGLFEIIKNIIYFCTYINAKEDGIYIIIATKNQENKKDIIETDLKTKDKTREIEEKMVENMQGIKVLKWKDCKELIDNIEVRD